MNLEAESLEEKLDIYWKNTAKERKRTHTGKMYKKCLEEAKKMKKLGVKID